MPSRRHRADELTDAVTNAVVPVHALLDEDVALEHDEGQHRYWHKHHERRDIKQDRDARHDGLLVLVVPHVGVHRSDQCRQHRVHRQAHHDHARISEELPEAAAAEHGKACQEAGAAARRQRGRFDNAVAFSRLPEFGYNRIHITVAGKVLVR